MHTFFSCATKRATSASRASVRHVHVEADAEVVEALSIAGWEALKDNLTRWRSAPSRENFGCFRLDQPVRAGPLVGVLEDSYPLLALLDRLRERGLTAVMRTIDHNDTVARLFDGRQIHSKKQ